MDSAPADGRSVTGRSLIGAAVADVLFVVLFAVIGRASHAEDLSLGGVAETAWPFLVGLVAGWLVTLAWRTPLAPIRTGLGIWAVTVAGGMLLRAVVGQGLVVAFVIVASVVLLVFLVGWRGLVTLVRRRRSPRGG